MLIDQRYLIDRRCTTFFKSNGPNLRIIISYYSCVLRRNIRVLVPRRSFEYFLRLKEYFVHSAADYIFNAMINNTSVHGRTKGLRGRVAFLL
jgi:hypothetical protein